MKLHCITKNDENINNDQTVKGNKSDGAEMDEDERIFFSKFSWWDEAGGSIGPLRSMNLVRVPTICKYLEAREKDEKFPLKHACILDVGCGGGYLCEPLACLGAEVVGIDPSEPAIEAAKKHLIEIRKKAQTENNFDLKLEYHNLDAKTYVKNNPGKKFDLVVLSEVVEHVDNWPQVVKDSSIALKKDGHILLTTINRNPYSYFKAIFLGERVFKYMPKNAHNYRQLVKPSEISNILKEVGITTEQVIGTNYNVAKKKFVYRKSTLVNFMLIGKKK